MHIIFKSWSTDIEKTLNQTNVRFDNSNTKRLLETMSEEEKVSFGFDVETIDWKDYIKNVHIPGLRRHVMKGRGMCSSPIS